MGMELPVELFKEINRLDLLENHSGSLDKAFRGIQPILTGYAPGLVQNTRHFYYNELGVEFTVPADFVFDGASIPGIFQGKLFPWSVGGAFRPEYQLAVMAHDYLYRTQICERKTADKIMKKLLLDNNVNRYEAGKMYVAVRMGGRRPWRKNGKLIKKAHENVEK